MNRSKAARLNDGIAAKVGVALAALLSLWGSFQYYRFESAYQQQYRDPYLISAQFSRFADVQAVVPEKAILGYLTDLAPGGVVSNAMFDGAQYVLAPRILQKSTRYDLVLGNFARPGDFAGMGRVLGLSVERDFGNGVVLFRREAR
jgi:hypothetical protein